MSSSCTLAPCFTLGKKVEFPVGCNDKDQGIVTVLVGNLVGIKRNDSPNDLFIRRIVGDKLFMPPISRGPWLEGVAVV
jgi:hypothetical protein